MRRIFVLPFFASLLLTGQCIAQSPVAPQFVVVFDLTGSPVDLEDPANKTYAFAVDGSQDNVDLRAALLAAARDSAISSTSGTALLEAIQQERPVANNVRSFAERGDIVEVYVFHRRPTTVTITFSEVGRSSRLETDLATLVQVGASIMAKTAGMAAGEDPALKVTAKRFTLSEPRAKLTVIATLRAPVPDFVASTPEARTSMRTGDPASAPRVEVTTGPSEHFFLSANAGASTARTLEYNAETNTLEPGEAPTSFLIGINFSLADLYVAPEGPLDELAEAGLYVGGVLEASSRPMNQVGLIVGFRHNPLRFLAPFISFDVVSPYAGVVWARSDTVDEDGTVRQQFGKGSFLWGVSLNLDRAVKWLSPGDGEGKDEGKEASTQ